MEIYIYHSLCRKSLAEFRPNGRNKIQSIFRAGVYEAKNTISLASVEFERLKRSNYARSKAASLIALAGVSH
jgi:hypothetical protein